VVTRGACRKGSAKGSATGAVGMDLLGVAHVQRSPSPKLTVARERTALKNNIVEFVLWACYIQDKKS